MSFARYAVYYTVPPGPLADFGAAWLGWDAAAGCPRPAPDVPGLPAPAHVLTETPRKYGLHATIKPPFHLAPGQSETALNAALGALCATQAPVVLDALTLNRLGRFLALTPAGDTTALNALAAAAVTALDGFRAPLTDADLARRRKTRLTPRQDALLTRWGYPYVMEEFRFHITLTGRLTDSQANATHTALSTRLAPLLPRPFTLAALTLAGEDGDGRFHEITHHPLTG